MDGAERKWQEETLGLGLSYSVPTWVGLHNAPGQQALNSSIPKL